MLCPLCNGIGTWQELCSACGGYVVECGRLPDWTGPYDPYEPIEDSMLHLGLVQEGESGCCHVIYCPTCQSTTEVMVSEWD